MPRGRARAVVSRSRSRGRRAARSSVPSAAPLPRNPLPSPRPRAPLVRANICDRLSSATDMPRSACQTDLEAGSIARHLQKTFIDNFNKACFSWSFDFCTG
ncbi:jg16403 [Pararge aegeria aegeria]|uniref:Jg16403 protein n=1 Tax=Pararge aegeria aegeria TaxID=348720 RepID=A0A8S4S9Y2_9NEOP|nr:jg16403 [Pararge aegeria aegeria]